MTSDLGRHDSLLNDDGPAALVLREHLVPVEGRDGILFPPTFASGEGFPGGYNIDTFGEGKNVCIIDTVGSQANRIEPLFAKPGYADLVPQVVVTAGDKRVNLLDAGHRAADAIVRCSSLQMELRDAFLSSQRGDAEPLARIAPTSLIFGVWDSRDTQEKRPRLLASTIRAYDVRKLTRSAQFVPAVEYVNAGLLEDPADNKKLKDAYAERGFIHVPASASPGGVIADGGIRRDATLHLGALRLLRASDEPQTLKLRRYLLGLAMTGFTAPAIGYLRQGCNLVLDGDKGRSGEEVYVNGDRRPLTVTHAEALDYARKAAADFKVGQSREVPFDLERAKQDVAGEGGDGAKKGKGKKK